MAKDLHVGAARTTTSFADTILNLGPRAGLSFGKGTMLSKLRSVYCVEVIDYIRTPATLRLKKLFDDSAQSATPWNLQSRCAPYLHPKQPSPQNLALEDI
jgi:hypothetical protein